MQDAEILKELKAIKNELRMTPHQEIYERFGTIESCLKRMLDLLIKSGELEDAAHEPAA